ncbi:MAG TPA: efflux RND transporter periplasmic adaptor subunit [Terriglobia bacterium]|nr:efflux RND transporter periplasmic adaptor subunit [Terriglobia bacterium]
MTNNHKKNGRRRRWLWIGILAILAVTGAVGLTAALRPNHSIDPTKIASVEWGDIAKSVVATGKIEPLAKVELKSKASGIVQKILVDYGDRVKVGQLLVELDKEQLRDRVKEAEANLEAARAAVESAEATFERNQVDAQGPDVPFLKATVERDRKLAADGIVAAAALDDADRAYRMALNKQLSAQRNVAVSKAEVGRAQAQVAQAQASLGGFREDLDNSSITSPMDGIVLSRDVEVGDAVSSILVLGSQATNIMTLGDMSTVYVLGTVDQADIGNVFDGQRARITVESFKDRKFEGRVTKISPMGVEKDNVTTFEVRVSIQNPTLELKANMSANAELIEQEKHHVLLIPEAAVLYDKERHTSVQLPDPKADTGTRKVAVQLGISNGVKTEVASGLAGGQKVVLQ